MGKIPEKLNLFLEELDQYEDFQLRMELLIELGEKFDPVPTSIATKPYPEINKIPACESEAYVFPVTNSDGTLNFYFDVENPQGISAKALAYILGSTLNGEAISEVVNISEEIAYRIFGKNLSMGKGLGLTSMVRTVKQIAESKLKSCD